MNHDPVPPARHDGTLHVPEEHVPEERLFKARLSLDGYVARFAVKDNKKGIWNGVLEGGSQSHGLLRSKTRIDCVSRNP